MTDTRRAAACPLRLREPLLPWYTFPVGLPISRSAVDRLGERLVKAAQPAEGDLATLESVIAAYDDPLVQVEALLSSLGHAPTTRLKTTSTLIDKLRREAGMGLKGMQDIAGARVVISGGRSQQDEVAASIVSYLSGGSRPPKTIDRRASPSHGYRAVHVILFFDGLPVEVQVRTRMQDTWAQTMESLADRWGRGIRYGEKAPAGSSVAATKQRRDLVAGMHRFAHVIDKFEDFEDQLETIEERLERAVALAENHPQRLELAALRDDRRVAAEGVRTLMAELADTMTRTAIAMSED